MYGLRISSARLLDLSGREARSADADSLTGTVLGDDTGGLKIRQPTTLRLVVRVADVVPGARALPAHDAHSGHD